MRKPFITYCFLFCITLFLLSAVIALGKSIVGDANNDGKVSVADISALVAYIMGNTPEHFNLNNADANGDGHVSVADVSFIVGQLMGTIIPDNPVSDSIPLCKDTLYICYNGDTSTIENPLPDNIIVQQDKADVEVEISNLPGLTIVAKGESNDGRLRITADTLYTLRLEGLKLTSTHAPAINSSSRQKMTLHLAEGTINEIEDSKKYTFTDTTEKANACLCSQGNITIDGRGTLIVKGKSKHGIASGKGMRLQGGIICVKSAPSDAIHSGKYLQVDGASLSIKGQKQDGLDADEYVKITKGDVNITVTEKDVKAIKCEEEFLMTGGELSLDIQGDASKGIKAKGNISISGGKIIANASGGVIITKGDPSYSTIVKGDADAEFAGGDYKLIHNGEGGRCISVDGNITITGGNYTLETHGDGSIYVNKDDEEDYYTARCIKSNGNLTIINGHIDCLSTGIGGKGLDADNALTIGEPDSPVNEEIEIQVITEGTCIIDNIDEDKRFGCPKAIKGGKYLYVHGGKVIVSTKGMGGEGLESKDGMKINGGTIVCNTFDDGMNAEHNITINGGDIYCNSVNNDGLDSNGQLIVNGGRIVSISQHRDNESLDAEEHQVKINGGSVIGLGGGATRLGFTNVPYYSTSALFEWLPPLYYFLHKDSTYKILDDVGNVIDSITCTADITHGRILIVSDKLNIEKQYTIEEDGNIIATFSPSLDTNF